MWKNCRKPVQNSCFFFLELIRNVLQPKGNLLWSGILRSFRKAGICARTETFIVYISVRPHSVTPYTPLKKSEPTPFGDGRNLLGIGKISENRDLEIISITEYIDTCINLQIKKAKVSQICRSKLPNKLYIYRCVSNILLLV